jgi:hypothetical protein
MLVVGPGEDPLEQAILELQKIFGRLPTEDELVDFVHGTDEQRLNVIRAAESKKENPS